MEFNNLKNIAPENTFELIPEDSVRFNRLKQQYFKKAKLKDFSYLEVLKEGSKFFTFDLPVEIGDYFVRREETPNLWLLEFPLLLKSEKIFDEKNKNSRNQDENSVKRYYQRWIVAKESYQKKIFSSLAAKLVLNTPESKNFIDLIYYSLILIYDDYIRNFNEAILQLQKAKILVKDSELEEPLKEELNYHIELYKSYAQMEAGNFEDASKSLSQAIKHNPFGITAKFYLAYVASITNQNDLGLLLLKEIFDFDISRLNYAAESGNISIFNYFLQNIIFTNLFYYSEFSVYSYFLEQNLSSGVPIKNHMLDELKGKLDKLKEEDLKVYCSPNITNSLGFFYKFIEEYKNNNSPILRFVMRIIMSIFNSVLDELKEIVRAKSYANYENEMKRYDGYIEESTHIMNQLSRESVDFKEEIKKRLSQTIQQIDEYTKESIQDIESSLQNLESQKAFNPVLTFRNSMSYNILVSIIVFVIGGVAGYYNNSGFFEGEFNVLLATILLTGLKWSALTFVVGFFVALALAAFVMVERSNQKQKLHRNIMIHKKEKDIAVDALKNEAESKQISVTENFNERIESHKRKIEALKREKEERRKILEKSAEEKYQPIVDKVDKLYLFNL